MERGPQSFAVWTCWSSIPALPCRRAHRDKYMYIDINPIYSPEAPKGQPSTCWLSSWDRLKIHLLSAILLTSSCPQFLATARALGLFQALPRLTEFDLSQTQCLGLNPQTQPATFSASPWSIHFSWLDSEVPSFKGMSFLNIGHCALRGNSDLIRKVESISCCKHRPHTA